METGKKYLIIGILVGLLGALVLSIVIVAIMQKPQQSQTEEPGVPMAQEPQRPRDYNQPLFNESFAIDAGKAQYYRIRIEISDKTHNVIEGRMEEKSNHGVNFLILDTKNYNAWTADNSNMMPYVRQKNVVSYDFSFVPDHSDDYYFVFDNTNSLFTNKLVSFHANWKYRQ